jgi:predicted DNA-binding transcriptional regulator AlpA
MDEQKLLTPEEVAKLTGLSVETVRAYARPGHPKHIPCYIHDDSENRTDGKTYTRPRFRKADVDRWMEARYHAS